MKEGTGSLSLAANRMDMHQFHFALSLNTWHVSVIHPFLEHWYGSAGNATIPRCQYAFSVLKYAVEHQKWPYNHGLFQPINEKMYRDFIGNPPDFSLQPNKVIMELYDVYLKTEDIRL